MFEALRGSRREAYRVARVADGWEFDGERFGTKFMALHIAIGRARAALARGIPAKVVIEQRGGGWRNAWVPGQPYLA